MNEGSCSGGVHFGTPPSELDVVLNLIEVSSPHER